jgi:hypothetical protein
MQLPIKVLPTLSQQIAQVVGNLVVMGMSGALLAKIVPSDFTDPGNGKVIWLFVTALSFFFLAGLGGVTVGLINLFGGSPFQHMIIDRQGITVRNFLGAQRFSWKDLGPFRTHRTSFFRPRGSELKYWILADTVGAIEGGASGLWPLSGSASLRIPAVTYLRSSWLVGSLAMVTNDAAGWLEQVRELARMGRLAEEDLPDPPFAVAIPLATEMDATGPGESPVPDSTDNAFGKRRKPVIER